VGIGALGIVIDGTEEQKRKYLPKLASGEIIGSFALTEPGAGSDAASLRASAVRDGNDYVLNGTKRFITNAPEAGVFTVFARTNPADKSAGGISAFLVEKGTPGLSLGKNEKKMGQWGGHVCDVILDDCRVPASSIIGEREGIGFKTAMRVLDKSRTHIAAVCVGAATRILNEALKYAVERKQFNKPISEFQLIQAMLADSKAEIYAARSMVLETARSYDLKKNISTESSCSKMFASEMVSRVADRAVQILGGSGYIRDYAVERFYRDVRLFRLYEGTTQIQQLIIARNMIKEVK
jgi:acyl-CoA dehydrogenase